ncbi:GNAT family N-acetyltransferase [Arthrobacter rhombi]|uniref:Acetyltransferase, GNAT family n=1 Tax=Arthrobacter rhombi TaxID=71253 RepID=A0A1R4FUP9_9MICC|nr:GNAT family N-acetyltransferase [Arthrobacter rhombi]SJM59636.1 acetyltransferase, GNAT family [Arthrobacter rhombi]
MSTIAGAQRAFADWHRTLAAATGGREFSTHGCQWVWQPTRARLVLLFPTRPDASGLRPGLAEGTRLGAREVHVFLNAAARDGALTELGFRDAPPLFWHGGSPADVAAASSDAQPWKGSIDLSSELPEATGADREEMAVLQPGRRIEHAVARGADGTLSGRGFAQLHDGGDLSIQSLAVGPSWRRQRAGTAILDALVQRLDSEEGKGQVLAASTPGASTFFRTNGLELLGKGRHLVQ